MQLKPVSLTASLVLLAAMAMPQVAGADVSGSASPSFACKASAGPGADIFYFDTLSALNTFGSTQYLTCGIPDVDGSATIATGSDIKELDVHYQNPTGAQVEFTCVFQTAHTGSTTTSTVFTITVPANTMHYMTIWTTSSTPALTARGDLDFYTMSCAIPGGAALGSIKAYDPGTINP